jgi:hypothetical protein
MSSETLRRPSFFGLDAQSQLRSAKPWEKIAMNSKRHNPGFVRALALSGALALALAACGEPDTGEQPPAQQGQMQQQQPDQG